MTARLRTAAPLLAVAMLLVLCALAFRRVFTPGLVLAAGLPGALVPYAVVVGVTRAGPARRLLTGLGAGLLATLVTSAVVVVTAASPAGSPAALGRALVSGWSRILTTTLPVAPTPERLGVLPLVAGVAGTLAALALRTRRPLAAAVPALLLLLAGLLLGVHGAGTVTAVAAPTAFGVLVLALADALAPRPAPAQPVRQLRLPAPGPLGTGVAVLLVAGCVAAGSAIGPSLPGRSTPLDLRHDVAPPVAATSAPDPLALLGRRTTADARTAMFDAHLTRRLAAAQLPWRLASFDRYDGVEWSSTGRDSSVGESLPGTAARATDQVAVQVQGLDGLWVPTAGLPTTVSPGDLRWNAALETLVDPRALQRGRTYTLDVALPVVDGTRIDAAPLATGLPSSYTSTPGCRPTALLQLGQEVVTKGGTPAQQAQALATLVSSSAGVTADPAATPGHSCARVSALFVAGPDHRGTSEQFATAFAVAARSIGLPTRLAVGFRPGEAASDGSVEVTGADAYAWPEVDLAGIGWTAFDPTPRAAGDTRPRTRSPVLAPVRATVTHRTGGPVVPHRAGPGAVAAVRHRAAAGTPLWLVALVVLLVLLVLLLAVPALLRRRRRAQRRRGPAREQVLGAWLELLDLVGPAAPPGATATEVASSVVERGPRPRPRP